MFYTFETILFNKKKIQFQDVKKMFSSPISCDEQHHFSKSDLISLERWHKFGLSESISESSQKLNCTFRFTTANEADKVNEQVNKQNGQVELLFHSFHLKTSSFINR